MWWHHEGFGWFAVFGGLLWLILWGTIIYLIISVLTLRPRAHGIKTTTPWRSPSDATPGATSAARSSNRSART